jgi:branched-chain amino acid transport system substrate-binding protein
MKIPVTASLIAILATSCTPTPPQSHDQQPVIAIGSELPTSGTTNADVVPLRAAIALAIEERGTVRGYRLVHEPFDYALTGNWDPFKGEQNVRIMIKEPQVLAMIGPYNSPVALFEIPVANEAGLVMISPSNTMDCLTSLPDPCYRRATSVNNYFRVGARDSVQARTAALFAIRKLHVGRFAVLTDGTPYSRLMTDQFASALTANGGTAVFRATYQQNSNDYTPLLREARDAGAQAVFAAGFSFLGSCRVRAGMSGVFPADAYMLSTDYITDTTCAPQAGTGANDHFLAMVSDSQPAPTSRLYQKFKARGIRPATYAFSAYDCAMIVIDAIGRAILVNGGKLPTRREVLDAVAATRDFVGSTRTFTFQPSGDALDPAVSVYRLENGHWSFWQNAS